MIKLPTDMVAMMKGLKAQRAEIEEIQYTLLKRQLIYAYENVAHYRSTFKSYGLDPHRLQSVSELSRYPIIEKKDIQENYGDFISREYSQHRLMKSHSSGSTGRPLWTYFDKKSWIRKKYLSKIRARMACGMKLGEKLAVFDTSPDAEIRKKNKQYISNNPFLKIRYFSVFDEIGHTVEELSRWQPQNLDGPPSLIFLLAEALHRIGIRIEPIERIFTSSEYLENSMRAYIEKIFRATIFDIYGCTETKEVAWQCRHTDGYHINEDEMLVEILNGRHAAKDGEAGEIILTDLRNRGMPLIRYRVGDQGMIKPGYCRCGLPFAVMSPLAGRSSEFIRTPDGQIISPYRFTTAIEKIDGLLQYQFIQTAEDAILVKMVIDGQEGDIKSKILSNVRNVVADGMRVSVENCRKIDIEDNGKLKVVKNLVYR